MNQHSEEIWILITRELSGETTADEKDRLRNWLNEDPKHRELFDNIKASWNQNPGESVDSFLLSFLFNYERGLGKLRSKLKEETGVSHKRSVIEKKTSAGYTWKMVAAIVVLVLSSSIFLTIQNWDEPYTASYATSEAEQRIITLADGSVIRLNRNSKIEVREDNGSGPRDVRLEGEAFFDVADDTDNPFVIHVGEAVVEVLGTSFNVKEGREIMVAVQEGMVSFRHRDHLEKSVARLGAGQLGLLSNTRFDISVEQTNIENYMSWKNGYLRFSREPFERVLRQLARIYGVEHEVKNSSMNSLLLTVYTERMQMEEVLETIALALGLEYEMQGGVIKWQQDRQ